MLIIQKLAALEKNHSIMFIINYIYKYFSFKWIKSFWFNKVLFLRNSVAWPAYENARSWTAEVGGIVRSSIAKSFKRQKDCEDVV